MAVTPELRYVYNQIGQHLRRIAKLFTAPKVMVIIRNPNVPDGDVIIGDLENDEAIATIQKLRDRKPVEV